MSSQMFCVVCVFVCVYARVCVCRDRADGGEGRRLGLAGAGAAGVPAREAAGGGAERSAHAHSAGTDASAAPPAGRSQAGTRQLLEQE